MNCLNFVRVGEGKVPKGSETFFQQFSTQQMFIRPEIQPLTLFTYHFSRKRYPFRIPSTDKWYSFHIPCLELCIPFNFCKCTVF